MRIMIIFVVYFLFEEIIFLKWLGVFDFVEKNVGFFELS